MAKQITITVSDETYKELADEAGSANVSVETVASEIIESLADKFIYG